MLLDITSIVNIKKKKTLDKLEITNLLRSENNVSEKVEKLNKEIVVLKNHIQQITIG